MPARLSTRRVYSRFESDVGISVMRRLSRYWFKVLVLAFAALSINACVTTTSLPSVPPPLEEPSATLERTDPWVLVDSAKDRMVIYKKGAAPIVFQNIAVGAAGVKEKQRRGDDVTPRGVYRVAWIRHQSKFERFIGLDYPSLVDATRGFESGRIDRQIFERIKHAHAVGEAPPQDTPLGGFIGIHGVGKGSLATHRLANWTGGCIAVENNQIHRLLDLVRIGTVVEIR